MKDYLKIGVIVTIIVGAIAFCGAMIDRNLRGDNQNIQEEESMIGGFIHDTTTNDTDFVPYAYDLIGTKTGTSTTFVDFYEYPAASSTYVVKAGGIFNQADISLFSVASTTAEGGGLVFMELAASNDDYCTTASSTSIYNTVLEKDINWFDIGNHIANTAGSVTIAGATTTLKWITNSYLNKSITLENINYECLRLGVRATSTRLRVQIKLK